MLVPVVSANIDRQTNRHRRFAEVHEKSNGVKFGKRYFCVSLNWLIEYRNEKNNGDDDYVKPVYTLTSHSFPFRYTPTVHFWSLS